jgi:hypothetical protein
MIVLIGSWVKSTIVTTTAKQKDEGIPFFKEFGFSIN